MKKMTTERAEEIALAIVLNRASKQSWILNPNDEGKKEWEKLGKRAGVDPEKMKIFMIQIALPATLKNHFSLDMTVGVKENGLSNEEVRSISLKAIQGEGISLDFNAESGLERLAGKIKIGIEELRQFFAEFVIPIAVAKFNNWKGCTIEQAT